jgi:succinyl-diaminopimelate desuccinylase
LRGSAKEGAFLLTGHTDVVPAGDPKTWDHDPFAAEIHDGWIWGRGTVDMKGALAAQIFATKAVIASKVPLTTSFILAFTVDDETGGPFGLKYALEEGLAPYGWPRPTFHILGEATDHDIFGSFKGRMWFRVSTKGKAAHGGRPDLGINAIDQMTKLIGRFQSVLRLEHPLMGRDTLNVGIIEGGGKVNMVPDSCTAHLDVRMCAPGSINEYEMFLRKIVEDLKKEDPTFDISEFEVYEKREPVEISPDHPHVKTMGECIASVSGGMPQFQGYLAAGDLYHSMRNGIPGAYYGPGEPKFLHQANERIRIDDLVKAAKIYGLMILRFCS